ncbi:transposase-like protein [Pantoea dispersa]
MFTEADRIRAIELYFKYGRKITAVIRELGYPTERNLRRWVRAWETCGGDISCLPRKERYSDAQKHAAVDHYLTHGCCLAYTRRTLGYPCSALLSAG